MAETCTATITVRDAHTCTRGAGHPVSKSVWAKNAQTHECCGYQWIDGAEGSTPHDPGPEQTGENR